MKTTHTHTRLGAQRSKLALALSLTLFITTLGYFGGTGASAQAAGTRLGQWFEHGARAALATRAVHGAASAALFAIITVNTTADDNVVNGNCTLREAIIAANTNAAVDACAAGAAGLDTIQFNLGAGTPSIAIVGSGLPDITEPLNINGNTGGATRVELNGAGAGAFPAGLTITAGGSTIRALVINRFDTGIRLSSGGNTIVNCFLGTNFNGTADLGNTSFGVFIVQAPNNIIGGTTAGERNIISGNDAFGVAITGANATGNRVIGNYIGTDVTGTADLGNTSDGVIISLAPNNTIGGTTAGERNIISGNDNAGVQIFGAAATGNKVSGNYIGTDVNGAAALGNTQDGVLIIVAANNTIGGATAAERNLISGNNRNGVRITNAGATGNMVVGNYIGTDVNGGSALPNGITGVLINSGANNNTIGGTTAAARNLISGNQVAGLAIQDSTSTGNLVQGNYIGVAANGTTPLGNVAGSGNLGWGVAITAPGNTIGGTAAGAANLIANNAAAGVSVLGGTAINNRILGNAIFANGGLGIDLGDDAVTPNDPADPDTGPNNLQNFPVLTALTPSGGTTTVAGTLNSTPNSSFRVEYFANAACDPSDFGEGQVFLGFQDVTTDASSNASLSFNFPTVVGRPFITATATNNATGDTSEFSACAPAAQIVGPGLRFPATSEVSDQRPGSVLVYNLYSSSIAASNTQNARINITNIHPTLPVAVHLFFVDGATCSIADSLVCLTANQTASFLASDIDPGTNGYIVAVASDIVTGCPTNFNYLIGDEYVKLTSGHAANLAAEGFAALFTASPACTALSVTAVLSFDGFSYDRVPRVLAASNIPSRADGNDTLIVLNRFGGNLAIGASTLTSVFGILYDDAENPLSFTFSPGTCQFRSALSNSFPRTAPRFEQFIPAGRSGWAKLYSLNDQGLFGAQFNFNANAGTSAGAFNQGHNLHKLTLTNAAALTIPVFPPNC